MSDISLFFLYLKYLILGSQKNPAEVGVLMARESRRAQTALACVERYLVSELCRLEVDRPRRMHPRELHLKESNLPTGKYLDTLRFHAEKGIYQNQCGTFKQFTERGQNGEVWPHLVGANRLGNSSCCRHN